ncbi:MAG: hypothetical protein O2894_11330 [Planctomycetota bacterium]|nr:hypothetical protein [Planctomycetota bacterium]
MARAKPRAGVEPHEVGGVARTHQQVGTTPARAGVRRAIQRLVVDHHRHAVPAHVHVELDQLSACADPQLERRQRVLRRIRTRAAMRDHQHISPRDERARAGLHRGHSASATSPRQRHEA